MPKPVKPFLAKGAAVIMAGAALVVGIAHFPGYDRADAFQVAEMEMLSLASAPPESLPHGPLVQIPINTARKNEPAVANPMAAVTAVVDCTAGFDAAPMAGAMVRLTANTPCAPETRVQMRHEGLVFDLMTDAAGRVIVDVPALAETASFEAEVGGETLRTSAAIPDFGSFSRTALQWTGRSGLQIHALEFGASYDSEGHVWANAPGAPLRAVRARGGFITRLGAENLHDGHMAEVYVFPIGMNQQKGTVRLSVEAEVTTFSCGTSVEGQTLQPGPDGILQTTQLTLEIPGCDQIGAILVLKNLLRDMKIASN